MKSKFLQLCLISGLLSLGSCVQGDIDDLQDQMDDLTEQVAEMEKAQQEALLSQISQLQALIAGLQSENAEQAEAYAALLANLQDLQAQIEDNAGNVFYGNVITDGDFAEVIAQGSTIITGSVIATAPAHLDALTDLIMVGGDLKITSETSVDLPNLTSVGGGVKITGVSTLDATISFPKVITIGDDFEISYNEGVISVNADELIMIMGALSVEENTALSNVSMTNLNQINELYINDFGETWPNYGFLTELNLNATDIVTDAHISYLAEGSNLLLGNIGNDFVCENNGSDTISIGSGILAGDFLFSNNTLLKEFTADNLTSIEGALTIESNSAGGSWGAPLTGLTALSAFDNLEFIGGNVSIQYNNALSTLDGFNKVTEIEAESMVISANGAQKTLVSIFAALIHIGPSKYKYADITISEKTEWFSGFDALKKANNLDLTFQRTYDESTYTSGETCKVEGFGAITTCVKLKLNLWDATEVDVFGALTATTFKDEVEDNEYSFHFTLPPSTVSVCSMEPILLKVKNSEYPFISWAKASAYIFDPSTYSELDIVTAYDQLTAGCN